MQEVNLPSLPRKKIMSGSQPGVQRTFWLNSTLAFKPLSAPTMCAAPHLVQNFTSAYRSKLNGECRAWRVKS